VQALVPESVVELDKFVEVAVGGTGVFVGFAAALDAAEPVVAVVEGKTAVVVVVAVLVWASTWAAWRLVVVACVESVEPVRVRKKTDSYNDLSRSDLQVDFESAMKEQEVDTVFVVAARVAASKSGHIASAAQEGMPVLGSKFGAAVVAEAVAVAKAARIEAEDVPAGSAVAADTELVGEQKLEQELAEGLVRLFVVLRDFAAEINVLLVEFSIRYSLQAAANAF